MKWVLIIEKWASVVASVLVVTLLMCHSMGEEVMNPANKVRLHIRAVDFGDPSLPLCCVEG